MKNREVIPVRKELLFLLKTMLIILVGIGLGYLVLFLLLSRETGSDYSGAFKVIARAYESVNYYIGLAILIQALLSTVVVFFLALYFSHKIAGPMFRLKAILRKWLEGENVDTISFRQTDFLPGVSRRFTGFLRDRKERKRLLAETEQLARDYRQSTGERRTALRAELSANLELWENDHDQD